MLSLNTRFATISPAQYQRINQVGLVVLIGSAAIAPAWANIIVSTGYALMSFLGFKQLVIGIIDRVLNDIPGLPAQRPAARPLAPYQDDTRPARPSTGNTHKYYGDGLYTRYGLIGRPGRRRHSTIRKFGKGH
jgi:hypothetical protein